jgi:GntR family transcriptional regulator/MocR family aminotransferase
VREQVEHLTTSKGDWLKGDDLFAALSGAAILMREVDGAPCTIKYHQDGSMTGVLGFANEEQDQGRWRTDDDRFYRQWSRWNYGEEKDYSIVIDGDQIKFFNEDGQIVDSGFMLRSSDEKAQQDKDLPAWSITEVATGPM